MVLGGGIKERNYRRRKLVDDDQWENFNFELNDLLPFIEWDEVSNTFTQVADSLRDALSGFFVSRFSRTSSNTQGAIMTRVMSGHGILNVLSASVIESFAKTFIGRWLMTSGVGNAAIHNWGAMLENSLCFYGVDDTLVTHFYGVLIWEK